MEIKRGYVKWTDENGVFHKELLADHPELLAAATPAQQIAAEEARRLNEAANRAVEETENSVEANQLDTLEALLSAPEEVLTTGDLVAVDDGSGEDIIVPVSEVRDLTQPVIVSEQVADSGEEPLWSEDHARALEQLKEITT